MTLQTLKTTKTATLALALLACAGLGFAGTAQADNGKKNGQGHKGGYEKHEDGDHDRDKNNWGRFYIGSRDRDAIERYIRNDRRPFCPPGLAKKNNGCLPPGQAKKYRIGDRLPDDLAFFPISDDLRRILSPVPRGYEYVQVNKDVLLISDVGKKVIDAVTLLSAIGN